jgi:hypothetical protein
MECAISQLLWMMAHCDHALRSRIAMNRPEYKPIAGFQRRCYNAMVAF